MTAAFKLKRENPAAFASNVMAQKIVSFAEDDPKLYDEFRKRKEEAMRMDFPLLAIAADGKRNAAERLAAIERFRILFDRIPAGLKKKLSEALGKIGAIKIHAKTGEVAKNGKRGARVKPETQRKLRLLARRMNENVTVYEMASEVFPGLQQKDAYEKLLKFIENNRHLLARMRRSDPLPSKF